MTRQGLAVAPGATLHAGYLDAAAQGALRDAIHAVLADAPAFTPRMPRSGKPFSVRMTNCGPLGWVSDETGYRYQELHPETGRPWPAMPERLLDIWRNVAGHSARPEACLINLYGASARMGLHQDRDEADFSAPVVSISLGDTALFRIGGTNKRDPTRSFRLASGDVFVFGGESRLAFHGIDRLYPGSSALLAGGGRINLTLRRVSKPS